MKNFQSSISTALIFAVILMSTVTAAFADIQSQVLYSDSAKQAHPCTDGSYLVWEDTNNDYAAATIMYKTLSEPNLYPASDSGSVNRYASVDAGIVVWQDGNKDIYGYDINLDMDITICTHSSPQQYPSVGGNVVVWEDERDKQDNDTDVYGFDLSTLQEFAVCTAAENQFRPVADGNYVVWMDNRGASWDIYGYDLTTSQEIPICTEGSDQLFPAVSGDIVVWQDHRNGSPDIYGYRISTGQEFSVCTDSASQVEPAVWGDIVVWNDSRNSLTGKDIYGYDIAEEREFPIEVAAGDDKTPDIYNGLVVWIKNDNIYGAWLPIPKYIEVLAPNGGEQLLAGNSYNIVWDAEDTISRVVIEWSGDEGGTWETLASASENTGVHTWDVPVGRDSSQCLVRVSEAGNATNRDVSDAVFTVVTCSPELTADLTGDCVVNGADLAKFMGQWLTDGF